MLAATYREVVIEDLDLAAMKQSMGRRAFRRSVSDAALGQIRPQLTWKMLWRGSEPTVADRWFASSKIHHQCGCRLTEPRKMAQQLVCARTGELVDRDINAALNLRDWPDHASCSTVLRPRSPVATAAATARTPDHPAPWEGA
jgi:putative transposase